MPSPSSQRARQGTGPGASSTAVTEATCSWVIFAGDAERSIGLVDGPAPLMADLASVGAVFEPIHRPP